MKELLEVLVKCWLTILVLFIPAVLLYSLFPEVVKKILAIFTSILVITALVCLFGGVIYSIWSMDLK